MITSNPTASEDYSYPEVSTSRPAASPVPKRFVRPRYWAVAYFCGSEARTAGRQHVFRSRKCQRAKLIALGNMPAGADRVELAEISRWEFHRRRKRRGEGVEAPNPPTATSDTVQSQFGRKEID